MITAVSVGLSVSIQIVKSGGTRVKTGALDHLVSHMSPASAGDAKDSAALELQIPTSVYS